MPIKKRTDLHPVQEKGRPRASRAGDSEGAAAKPETVSPTAVQFDALEQGIRLFRSEQFAEAREWFLKAGQGPDVAMAHAARTRAEICARRLQKPALQLHTADDHYHYGVERLNARDLEAARKHLEIALTLNPHSDYMLYAFSAALALSGDVSGSYENLKRAIEIDPRNRTSARHDPDFSSVAHNPLFSPLLFPERNQIY